MAVQPCVRHPRARYRKAFDVEPSLHSGINAAVLLMAAGQHFEDSEELQLIGEPRSQLPAPTNRDAAGPGKDTGQVLGLSLSLGAFLPISTPGSLPIPVLGPQEPLSPRLPPGLLPCSLLAEFHLCLPSPSPVPQVLRSCHT